MDSRRGTFIVIEGTDGSGKSTQFGYLAQELASVGYEVVTFKFPRYSEPSSYFVREYLGGGYGSAEDVGPYTASLFYALDRFAAAEEIRKALDAGKIVIADRYVGANMAHQGTKFRSAEERRGYFIWLDNLEFEMLRIPRPDATLVLRVPASVSQKLLDKTGKTRDIHEQSADHLEKAVEVYDDLTQLFPKDFMRIDCARGDDILSIDDIRKLIWEKVTPLLAPPKSATPKAIESNEKPTEAVAEGKEVAAAIVEAKAKDEALVEDVPLVHKDGDGTPHVTAAGKAFLKAALTNAEGAVYACNDELEPLTVATAIAHLSPNNNDLRKAILNEYAAADSKESLNETAEMFGQTAAHKLGTTTLVVEGASDLLVQQLERSKHVVFFEQPTSSIDFDKKNDDAYPYFTPAHFDETLKRQYCAHMDGIFEAYADVVHRLTDYLAANGHADAREQACEAAQPMLPTAKTLGVGMFASSNALENLITNLLGNELAEAKTVGDELLAEARKAMPAFLEHVDAPDNGGATIAYRANTQKGMAQLAEAYLPDAHADANVAPVQLTGVSPRNELDLVPDMLYEHSSLPLKELQRVVANWPYDQKASVFDAYIGERSHARQLPGQALKKARYSWDVVSGYETLRNLQRSHVITNAEWQTLTPRYGYEIPKLIDDAGLSDLFESAFDISLKLYSLLQQHGYALEAQYATLLGHRMRWTTTFSAQKMFRMQASTTSMNAEARNVISTMHGKLSETHPLLAEAAKTAANESRSHASRLVTKG